MPKFKKGHKKVGGRKKGGQNKETVEKEKALQVLNQEILKKWYPLISAKIKLAEGILVEKKLMGEVVGVYKKPPDSQSLEYLLSIVVGKPKESPESPILPVININITSEAIEKATKRVLEKLKQNEKKD